MRAVEHICMPHSISENANLSRRMIRLAVIVPDFQDMKALLWTNANAHNGIRSIRSCRVKNACGCVALKRLMSNALWNLNTVRAAVDIATVLPHWWERIAHKEIHAGQKVPDINCPKSAPKLFKVAEGSNLIITGWRPVCIIWCMEVKSPCTRRKGGRECHYACKKGKIRKSITLAPRYFFLTYDESIFAVAATPMYAKWLRLKRLQNDYWAQGLV